MLDCPNRARLLSRLDGTVRLAWWSRGRVVLLGDAGYCPAAYRPGTSLTLAGGPTCRRAAATSADATAATEQQAATRLRRLRSLMRPYVEQGQSCSGRRWQAPDEQARIVMVGHDAGAVARRCDGRIFSKANAIQLPSTRSLLTERALPQIRFRSPDRGAR